MIWLKDDYVSKMSLLHQQLLSGWLIIFQNIVINTENY